MDYLLHDPSSLERAQLSERKTMPLTASVVYWAHELGRCLLERPSKPTLNKDRIDSWRVYSRRVNAETKIERQTPPAITRGRKYLRHRPTTGWASNTT